MTKCLEISSLSHNTQRKSFSQIDKKKNRVEAFKKLRISNWKCCDKESREFGNVTIFTNFPSFLKKSIPSISSLFIHIIASCNFYSNNFFQFSFGFVFSKFFFFLELKSQTHLISVYLFSFSITPVFEYFMFLIKRHEM